MNENETTRYTQFCQFRKEIHGSQDYLIVGIDVAKDKHHAFLGTATGQSILRRLIFDNNASGFSTLIERAEQLMRQFNLNRVVYLNAVLGGTQYLLDPPEVMFHHHGRIIKVGSREIAINALKDEQEADRILKG